MLPRQEREAEWRARQTSIRFPPVFEEERELDEDVVCSPPQMEYKREQPVITRVSLMYTPLPEVEKDDSFSSSSTPIMETPKQQDPTSPQQNYELLENSHALLLLLHQRDLEIKGLKNAAQKDPCNRLGYILQEIVKPRQKGPAKKSPTEIALQKEVDQLTKDKTDNEKKIKELEEQLVKSKLHVLHLQHTVRALAAKSDEEMVTDSSLSLDKGTKLEYERYELWSETGSRVTSDTSDLRLRRIPKHTSFVDAFNKFGSVILSDEDKKEIITKLEAVAEKAHTFGTTSDSSLGSSRTDSQLPSEQSSWTIIPSQKSNIITSSVPETKTTDSSKSLLSFTEKTQQEKTIDVHVLDPWHLAQAGLTLGWLSDEEKSAHAVPSIEGYKRCHSVTGSLKIVSVHRKGKFVRIFNALLNKEVDLSGYIIQQWVGGCPVSLYRFPSGTILPAQHHITVWAAAASLAHEQPSDPLPGPRFFSAGPECVTVLCDHSGQVVSRHTNPHQFTAAAEAYSDNVDLSVDKFPLGNDDDDEEEEDSSRIDVSFSKRSHGKGADPGILVKRRYSRHFSIDASATSKTLTGRSTGTKAKIRDTSRETSGSVLLSSKPPSRTASESPSSSSEGDYFAYRSWKPLVQEPELREFKTTLDTTLPIVSLIGQKSARSRYGFKYMTYMPTTTDLHLRRYCPAR